MSSALVALRNLAGDAARPLVLRAARWVDARHPWADAVLGGEARAGARPRVPSSSASIDGGRREFGQRVANLKATRHALDVERTGAGRLRAKLDAAENERDEAIADLLELRQARLRDAPGLDCCRAAMLVALHEHSRQAHPALVPAAPPAGDSALEPS